MAQFFHLYNKKEKSFLTSRISCLKKAREEKTLLQNKVFKSQKTKADCSIFDITMVDSLININSIFES